jgi:LmbE family N-acetylglucosaminyl deacetylase
MSRSSKRRAPRVLVIAPHPDDEALATGGVIQEHLRKGHVVKVLLVTCGDGQRRGLLLPPRHFLRLGERRYRESLDALRTLGVHEKRVIALGYPDRGLAHLSESPYRSRYTKVCAVPYEWAYRPGAPYTREALLTDLAEIFTDERPQLIYLPHPRDRHGDHQAVSLFVHAVVHELGLAPQLRHYLIHYGAWPLPLGRCFDKPLVPPRSMRDHTHWLVHELRPHQIERKYQAIRCYRTQTQYIEDHLLSYVRRNELFDLSPDPSPTRGGGFPLRGLGVFQDR